MIIRFITVASTGLFNDNSEIFMFLPYGCQFLVFGFLLVGRHEPETRNYKPVTEFLLIRLRSFVQVLYTADAQGSLGPCEKDSGDHHRISYCNPFGDLDIIGFADTSQYIDKLSLAVLYE